MDALKRTLLSLVLVGFSSLNGFGKEKADPNNLVSQNTVVPQSIVEVKKEEPKEEPSDPIYDLFYKEPEKEDPRTLGEILGIVDKRYSEVMQRNDILFKNVELEKMRAKYGLENTNNPINSGLLSFTEGEEKLVRKYGKGLAEDLFRETRHSVIWVDELEENMKDSAKDFFDSVLDGNKEDFPWLHDLVDSVNNLFRYGFSFKGEEADGHTYSPTLNEERRLEDRRRKERTGMEFVIPEFGRRYLLDIGFGYNPDGLSMKKLFGGFETEIALIDFQILGHKFNKFKLECDSDQKAKARLTKLIGRGWHYTVFSEFHRFPKELENIGLTLIRETTMKRSKSGFIEDLPSRLRATVFYDDRNDRHNRVVYSFDYILRF
jgi:hypothetical protein